jgi:glycerol-3-phosphate acyltransferase PlsY
LGAIPSAYLITRWRIGQNIRLIGDGNAGARNVWHVVGPGWGGLVAVLDALKGVVAILLGRQLGVDVFALLLVGPAAILGHAFPFFLRFQGGKGLSTTMGILLAWTPWSTTIGIAILVLMRVILRDFDRAIVWAAAGVILLPLAFGYPWTMSLYALVLFCLLWARKLQDLAHERKVWASSGWRDVDESFWYGESATSPESSVETPKNGV